MARLWLMRLMVLVIAMLPRWSYSRGCGYFPSGLVGVILLMLVLMLVLGHIFGQTP